MNSPILILYATQTGNSMALAADAAKALRSRGCTVRMENMADVSPSIILEFSRLCAIVSTWGDGDPPDDAVGFFEALHTSTLDFNHLRFSICALGDSSYDKFCGCGHQLQSLLERRGARMFYPLAECDVDFDAAFAAWLEGATAQLLEMGAVAQ